MKTENPAAKLTDLITLAEAAELKGVSLDDILYLINKGELISYELGNGGLFVDRTKVVRVNLAALENKISAK